MCNIRVRERRLRRVAPARQAKGRHPRACGACPRGQRASFGAGRPSPSAFLAFHSLRSLQRRYAPRGRRAQARLPRSSTLLDAAPTSPALATLAWGDRGSRACAWRRGVAPQRRPFGLGLTCSPCCARYRSLCKCPHRRWLPPKHRPWTGLLSRKKTRDLIGLGASLKHSPHGSQTKALRA